MFCIQIFFIKVCINRKRFFHAHGILTIHETSWKQHNHPVHWHNGNIHWDILLKNWWCITFSPCVYIIIIECQNSLFLFITSCQNTSPSQEAVCRLYPSAVNCNNNNLLVLYQFHILFIKTIFIIVT